jgi:hypothetical protein
MRRHRQAVRAGKVSHLDVLGDAAQARDVGLDVVNGTRRDEALEGVEAVELLA